MSRLNPVVQAEVQEVYELSQRPVLLEVFYLYAFTNVRSWTICRNMG